MKFYNVSQGSAEWYRLRSGRPTASNFHRIITARGEPSRQAMAYLYRLVAERLLNETLDDDLGFVQYVKDGQEREPQAVALFNFTNEVQLEPGGFMVTDDGRVGCSPDRVLKGGKEAVEVKCPAPQTMVKYYAEGVGDDYKPQVQGHIFVGGFDAVHFFAYHPQMPPYHKITLPDRHYLVALQAALTAFCNSLDVMTERMRSIGAYVVSRQLETPFEAAYGEAPLKIVTPEVEQGSAPEI